jgi:hypothetical protein
VEQLAHYLGNLNVKIVIKIDSYFDDVVDALLNTSIKDRVSIRQTDRQTDRQNKYVNTKSHNILLFSSFDSALVDKPCIVSGVGSICYYFFPLTYALDLCAAALHLHKCTKAHLDFEPQLLSVIVHVSIKSHFNIETIQLKSVEVHKY